LSRIEQDHPPLVISVCAYGLFVESHKVGYFMHEGYFNLSYQFVPVWKIFYQGAFINLDYGG